MGFFDAFKIVIVPAIVAAAIYALGAYVILPLYRSHHARYAQYIPIDTLRERTSGFRARVQHSFVRFLLPNAMRWRYEISPNRFAPDWDGSGDDIFGDEEAEQMVGFDVGTPRRERLPVRRADDGGVDGEVEIDSQRRLSRELEEGFKDDSEEDDSERG